MGRRLSVFLESHNLKNPNTGFGQFNHNLIKALIKINDPEIKFTIHTGLKSYINSEYGKSVKYKIYLSATRHKIARIRTRYDIWHCLNQNIKIEPYYNIPYILTIHDVIFLDSLEESAREVMIEQIKEKINRSSAITYISHYSKEKTHQHFKIPNIPEYVIYNGNPIEKKYDLGNFRPELKINGEYLFSIGVFAERKNFLLLIKMMDFLPNLNLIIAGNNDSEYGNIVRKTIEEHNLQNRVHLVGKISEKSKQYYYSKCKAFVFPSNNEGFGLPVIEAMSFGVPVFLSRKSSLPEIGGEHAFYWDNLNPSDMANVLINSINIYEDNPNFYNDAYRQRAAKFSWTNAAKQYIEVYKSLFKK